MSKTPTKTDSNQFKHREITTPGKDHQGISKTIHSHIKTIYDLLSEWAKVRDKGVRFCRAISALKLYECIDDYYPSQLKTFMESLLEILDAFKNIIDAIKIVDSQVQALAKLQTGPEPLFSSWPVSEISKTVTQLFDVLHKEYSLKKVIIENVAHCRDEHLIEVYLSSWEFEVYFNIQSYSFLFAEVGVICNS